MIHFNLLCDKDHVFDGWFRSNKDFETQGQKGLLLCPMCGSKSVHKALMTPSLSKKDSQIDNAGISSNQAVSSKDEKALSVVHKAQGVNPLANMSKEARHEVMNALRRWRRDMIKHSENVGTRFAEEARKIHYKEVKERPIYGVAEVKEVAELFEEGIECTPLPILPEDNN